jgi:hypothetical protein
MKKQLLQFVRKSFVVFSLAGIIAGVLSGFVQLPGGSQTVKAASNSSQIQFDAGYSNGKHLVLTYLKICGYNQTNVNYVCWSKNTSQQYYVTLYGWWWKIDRDVNFNFTLVGYGDRSCSIKTGSNYGYPDMLRVVYEGNGKCSYSAVIA